MITLYCAVCQVWCLHYVASSATACKCRHCCGYTPHYV